MPLTTDHQNHGFCEFSGVHTQDRALPAGVGEVDFTGQWRTTNGATVLVPTLGFLTYKQRRIRLSFFGAYAFTLKSSPKT